MSLGSKSLKAELQINVSERHEPAYCCQIEQAEAISESIPWYYDIGQFIKERSYLPEATPNYRRAIRQQVVLQAVF